MSKTERELGGIPNSSEDVKQSHASAIESYIEKYVGLDFEGDYREKDDIGSMYFQRTLEDWAKFDITNRTRFDAAISSGEARYTSPLPCLPGKFRLPELTVISPGPFWPTCPDR